jgi:hypothetical protein
VGGHRKAPGPGADRGGGVAAAGGGGEGRVAHYLSWGTFILAAVTLAALFAALAAIAGGS